MAIDSKAKRASATFLLVPSWAKGVIPSGTVNRQDAAWAYRGIAAAAATVVEIITLVGTLTKTIALTGAFSKTEALAGSFTKTITVTGQLRE